MHGARSSLAVKSIRRMAGHPAALFAIFLGAVLLRCWPRLVSPQVWAEDGMLVLGGFIDDGWATFFDPVNGYWQLIGRLISALSLAVSIHHYPLLGTLLTCIFSALVGVAVALSPTALRGRPLCALAIFLVPTDPEVFGLPLYAFWWAAVLLFLLVLWDENHESIGWRALFLLLGGLSSPVILLITPVLYYRAFRYRGARAERWLAVLATAIALLQASFMLAASASQLPSAMSLAVHVVPKFLGGFLLGNLGVGTTALWLAGIVLAVVVAAWLRLDATHRGRWVLMYLLAGAIALSVMRIDPGYLTYGAGPRYFFYSTMLLSWICIQLFFAPVPLPLRGAAAMFGVLALVNLLPVVTRFHQDLQWQAHVRSCRLFPEYRIPVEVDGRQTWPGWDIHVRGERCAVFLHNDLLQPYAAVERKPVFAYTVQGADWERRDTKAVLESSTMAGSDLPRAGAAGYRIVGSRGGANSTGELHLRLHRGASVLYRAGRDKTGQRIEIAEDEQRFLGDVPAANAWVRLTFSNSALPESFTVRIRDTGTGDEQWSAVALPAGEPAP